MEKWIIQKLEKNGMATLTLNYIPISLYTTRTIIYFSNNIIGEFQHQIIGTVQPPSVTAQIRPPMSLTVDQIFNWQYVINPKNDMISRAKKAIQSMKKRKGSKQEKDVKKTSNNENHINQQYIIEINPNPYVNAKQTIWINEKSVQNDKAKDSKHQTKNESRTQNPSTNQQILLNKNSNKKQLVDFQNKIPFTIICKNPVYQFNNYVLIYNKAKTDVRRFRIMFTIQPKPLKAILEMNVPARGQITQNLPIVNNTDRDWNIKITWQPDMSKNGQYFIIPSQFNNTFPVKKQSIGNFPITFKPKWTNKAQAKLIMSNPLTLDNFEYQIIGNGQDPLAEDHLQIKCQAKERIKKQIIVKNPYSQKPINLRVQVDLLNCQAPSKLTIPSAGKQKFQFYVQPMLCGQYTGSITFYQQEGPQYLWYTVSVVTNYPQPYKTLDFSTQIRSKIVQKLYLPYKQSKQHTFQVIINGNGLSGSQEVTLKPNQENFYCLEYLPLEIGEQKGSIIFINNQAGQILFQINLNCQQKPPVVINDIKSPLGVSAVIQLQLENPINKRVTLNIFNSNEEQFVFKSPVIKLQPYQKKIVEVQYIPASLDKIQHGQITFKSKQVGDWVFQLSGTGLAPVPFEPKIVYNGVYQQHSQSVKFRNPFKYEIMIGLKLVPKSNRDNNIFKLLSMNKTKFSIDSFGILQIPFSFIPPACSRYYCDILVMISQKIYWTFPIIGVTQINKGQVLTSLTSSCRQSTSSFSQIQLQGVQNFKQNNQYSLILQNVPTIYQRLVQKSFSAYFRKDKLNHANDCLQAEFNFKPMKPIKVSFDILVTRKEGSRWRYRVNLQGTEPQPDDIIQIESNLLVTSTVTFKLTNWEKNTANFKARFTSDSGNFLLQSKPMNFSVEPKQGSLAKYGSKGTPFYISFTPVEYGKQKRGKLIIQTNDMYWSYILKGSLPKYVPPKNEIKRSRISSSIK